MNRRDFTLGALAMACTPEAVGQTAKVWRVGYLSLASPAADAQWVAALRHALRDFGYVEGRNLVFEQRHAMQQRDRLPALAAELVQKDVHVLVVYGLSSYPTLTKQVGGRPVVMTVHADPVGSGLVASLGRPGGNLTGLTDGHAELSPKRLELLKEVVPSAKRIGVLFNPRVQHAVRQAQLAQTAGQAMGLAAVPIEITGQQGIEAAFAAMKTQRIEGLILAPDPTWWVGNERRISDLAVRNRLPSVGSVREFAEHGILLAYGTNFTDLWRQSAAYVDKILKGASPGELPIEHPRKFDLVINLRTAKAIGVTVPGALLLRADQVIE